MTSTTEGGSTEGAPRVTDPPADAEPPAPAADAEPLAPAVVAATAWIAGLGLAVLLVATVLGPGDLLTDLTRLVLRFTVQSAVAALVVATAVTRAPGRAGSPGWSAAGSVALAGLWLSAVVNLTVLGGGGFGTDAVSLAGLALHVVLPVVATVAAYRAMARPTRRIPIMMACAAWGLAALGAILGYGSLTGWYPYDILDPAVYTRLKISLHAVILLVLLVAAGWAVATAPRRAGTAAGTPPRDR